MKGRELAAEEVNEYDIAAFNSNKYKETLAQYRLENPSEAQLLTEEYYRY